MIKSIDFNIFANNLYVKKGEVFIFSIFQKIFFHKVILVFSSYS